MKEVEGQQKSVEKHRQQRKAAKSSKPHPDSPGGEGEAEDAVTR
jgi:hypothetical protein